jgi:hypothetical protein
MVCKGDVSVDRCVVAADHVGNKALVLRNGSGAMLRAAICRVSTGFLALVAVVAAVSSSPAAAQDSPSKSRLTTIDLNNCTRAGSHRDGGAWRCKGLPGYPIYVAEGDLRQMMGFGANPERRRSATQSLGPFNTIFEGKIRPTVEWRVTTDAKGRAIPFATIVRYRTERDGTKGHVLLITKVDAQQSCHLAKLDATASETAMALAREWADANARLLPCPDEPQVVGGKGTSPM